MSELKRYSLTKVAENVSVTLSCRGELPEAGVAFFIPCAPVKERCFTVAESVPQWRISEAWKHRLGEIYLAVRAAVSRFSRAVVRKYKHYFTMVKTVCRPVAPQFLRL